MSGGAPRPDVCHVLPGKLGGVVQIVENLLAYRDRAAFSASVVRTYNSLDVDTPHVAPLGADVETRFEYTLPTENLHRVLGRLARAVPPGPGLLVSNDWIELAMLHVRPTDRTVVQILHGDHDYYYDLAKKHEGVIDAWIAYSRAMYDKLVALLPERRASVFHLPYGVPFADAARTRQAVEGPLRLLFAARLSHGQKGVFDLPEIDRRLAEAGVAVRWTVAGEGPDGPALRESWKRIGDDRVRFLGRLTNAEVYALFRDHDVLVLPTRAEGFPVALLEAMGAGLVPVVSAIESGVPEVVEPGRTGLTPPVGDVGGFARAIGSLANDREALEEMSRAARRTVAERFDVRARTADYEALFGRFRELKRERRAVPPLPYGSRLDKGWLPNAIVYPARAAARAFAGKRWR